MLEYSLVALIIFGAGIVRGFTGFGFALAAAPLLAFIFPPLLIVPVVLLLDMAAGMHAGVHSWQGADKRVVLLLTIPSLILAPLGAILLSNLSEDSARLWIGLIVIAAIPGLLFNFRFHASSKFGEITALGTGGVSGLLNGGFGLGGPPIGLYMASTTMLTKTMRATTIIYFLFADTGAVLSNFFVGNIDMSAIKIFAIGLIFVLLGNHVGSVLFQHYGSSVYRRAIAILLSINALILILSVI